MAHFHIPLGVFWYPWVAVSMMYTPHFLLSVPSTVILLFTILYKTELSFFREHNFCAHVFFLIARKNDKKIFISFGS